MKDEKEETGEKKSKCVEEDGEVGFKGKEGRGKGQLGGGNAAAA